MRIKILGLTLLFMLFATEAYSQKKCRFDYNKKDPITGEETKGNTFPIRSWWKLGFNRSNNDYHIGMGIRLDGNVRYILTPENTIIFKLENDEIITVNAREEYAPVQQATSNGVSSVYSAIFNISEDDLRKFAESPLKHVRMTIGPNPADASFNAKKGRVFQENARCILE